MSKQSTSTIETNNGSAAVDPYTAKNVGMVPLAQKMEDLNNFMAQIQYGMMTTQQSDGELLVSRCMALAGKVSAKEA